MKKILFSLAALAALSMVAVGCKKATDAAKEKVVSTQNGGGKTGGTSGETPDSNQNGGSKTGGTSDSRS